MINKSNRLTKQEKRDGWYISHGRKYPPNENKEFGWSDACWENAWDKASEPLKAFIITEDYLRAKGMSEEEIERYMNY